uniref:Uncharacterized protein n=1 Tax=Oryza brachyantha TaxID=4533 RepID=J3LJG2_ORYBR
MLQMKHRFMLSSCHIAPILIEARQHGSACNIQIMGWSFVMQLGKQGFGLSTAIIKLQFKDQEPGPGKTGFETLKHGTTVCVNT